jgi:dihydroorotate dehydrogenase
MDWYQKILKPLLFCFDPETAHRLTLSIGALPGVPSLLSAVLPTLPSSACVVAGLNFKNRLGLAAGCDKEGTAIRLFAALGFGHIEIGTVTPRPQIGNPRPRVFRFPKEGAVINRMGFPSQGMEVARRSLLRAREVGSLPILGLNIGKNKDTPLSDAATDYGAVLALLGEYVDYATVNVSSPNTPELRSLQEPARLRDLLSRVQDRNRTGIPLFVKLAPDLEQRDLEEIVPTIVNTGVAGIIATNTTIKRPESFAGVDESGGLSGRPLLSRSIQIIRDIRALLPRDFPLIGVGGIGGGDDSKQFRQAGADLVQLYTGLIFRGPSLIPEVLRSLANEENGLLN